MSLSAQVQGGLIDAWRASDLAVFNDGDAVGSWTSQNNRTVTASIGNQPLLKKGVTPANGPAVRFNRNWMQMLSNSPVGGLSTFSIAIVLRADAVGANNSSQWYGKTGIVDAEQPSYMNDWGTVIDENGQLGFGVGNPDKTVYSTSAPSLVDGFYHAAVFTWGNGAQSIYVDNQWMDTATSAATAVRNDAGFSIGATHTGAGGTTQRFVGDIVEIRFYDTALSDAEVSNVIQELTSTHIATNQPVIQSFTATPGQVLIGTPVTLSWNVSKAETLQIDPGVGLVTGTNGTTIAFPRTNTTYTLTASNAFGVRTAQSTVLVDQGIPTAANQSVVAPWNQAFPITLAGSDPNGGTLTYSILSNPSHGSLSGTPPNIVYTSASNYIGNDQFTFKVNDGEFDSPPATVSVQVTIPPTAPSAILLSTTNINSSTGHGSFIASLRAIDINTGDTSTFTLVPGFADNSNFVVQGNLLQAGPFFQATVGATYSIRIRATDSSGLWTEQTFGLKVTADTSGVVINEIHYNPSDNTVPEEFIELYNPKAVDVDVSFWKLTGGVSYTIPQNTVIKAGGFLVIAEDPSTIQSRYGVTSVGPWTGSLSSDGETVTLEDSNNKKVNEVSCKSEFPWPVGANGEGGSMALVNPSLDNTLGSSWRTETPPTPGSINGVYAANAAPNIRQVQHSPQSPTSTNSVVITAKVTDPEGVASVQLQYQIVTPGNYIPAILPWSVSQLVGNPTAEPLPNPAYDAAANWLTVPMVDNGADGDAQAGDNIYTAVLPPQANRVLVRYRIVVTDSLGVSRRAPFEDDPSLNFAYYVYNGIPDYQGVSAAALQTLPVYALLSRSQDVTACLAYNGSDQLPQFDPYGLAHLSRFAFNWPGTIVYDGVVYDNIRYRLHGANGRYQQGKREWRFRFNKGAFLAVKDQNGVPYPHKWAHLTTGKGSDNRLVLTFCLNESLNYFLWNKVGVPAPNTFSFHFRVVQGAQEAPGHYTGDFWGLNWAQEDYDGRFLETHNMAKGNLYKLVNAPMSYDPGLDMLGQQRYQGPLAVNNGMDGAAIQSSLLDPSGLSSDWIRANVNCDKWYRYHVICEAVRNYDFWPSANKNAGWYFEPVYNSTNNNYGRMWTLPFDTDCTWGPTWNNGQDLVYNGVFNGSHPDLVREYRNIAREVRDLLFQPDQINPLIDAFAAQIKPFVPADLARWSNAPSSGANYVSLNSGAGFTSPALSGGLAAYVQDLKDFMFKGGTRAWWIDRVTVAPGGWVTRLDTLASDTVPSKPTITYVGPTNYPVNGLTFQSSAYGATVSGGSFAAMQWRVAEITPTNQIVSDPAKLKLEWDAVWDSGEMPVFASTIKVPAVSVYPGKLYRARVRHKDALGRWSNWSAPIQFSPTQVDLVTQLQQDLVISELMYHAPKIGTTDGDDLDFIELKNKGTTVLDLSGLTFTSGVSFTFTNGTSLAPRQFFLLGRNAAALQAKYPGLVVNGVYTGKLDNNGETITLSHPYGAVILSLTYSDSAPWPVAADGYGFSLVLDENNPGDYRASATIGGSPASDDAPTTIPSVLVNEILSSAEAPDHDAIELYNAASTNADISGWFLSDDPSYPWKFRIPDNTVMAPGTYAVFNDTQYDPTPGAGKSFGLSSLGEQVYVFSADLAGNLTGYSHGFAFPGALRGQSFGRYVNSVGAEQFPPMTRVTFGTNNASPAFGPVVITEICYSTNAVSGQFVELRNITSHPVPLYDVTTPTNTWKLKGLSFVFPTNVVIDAGGCVILTALDPVAFRAQQSLSAEVQVFQFTGKISDTGEFLQVLCPDIPNTSGVPYYPVDEVQFSSTSPWPAAGNGSGLSLQRYNPASYGNDPANWRAAVPTPGSGLPSGLPVLALTITVDPSDASPVLGFPVEPNRSYTIQYTDDLSSGSWQQLKAFPAVSGFGKQALKEVDHSNTRFYRLATP